MIARRKVGGGISDTGFESFRLRNPTPETSLQSHQTPKHLFWLRFEPVLSRNPFVYDGRSFVRPDWCASCERQECRFSLNRDKNPALSHVRIARHQPLCAPSTRSKGNS